MSTLSKPIVDPSNQIVDYPEIQLLLYCARSYVDTSTANQIKILLEQGINWTELVQLALRHRVAPLLYQNLQTICPTIVPENVLNFLRNHFQSNAQRNLFRTNELLKVMSLMETHHILAIPFKGTTLAVIAYGNLGLRTFGDLDILAHKQDLSRIKNLLVSQGYQLGKDLDWECQFIHPKLGVEIDIHWRITPRRFQFKLGLEQLKLRSQPLILAGKSLLQPSPEDLLLILCVGWCKDYYRDFSRLAQLCDVAEFLRRHTQLDWLQVLQRSHHLGIERMLLFTLVLTQDLLGIDLPSVVLNRLQDNAEVSKLTTQIGSWLGYQPILEEPFWSSLSSVNHRLYFAMRERLSDRIIYLFYSVIAPTEKESAMLVMPKFFSFLYYPFRLVRLAYKYGTGWQQLMK